jgi:glycine hydroxymethyltransferase
MVDEKLQLILFNEESRQSNQIELIASENFASEAVRELCGSVFTNKYAEGYPGARYYNGCEYMDAVETYAQELVQKLYGCTFSNVQPHSGVNANTAVYQAFLKPGDRILGMDLASGGHLSHGAKPTLSGKVYKAYSYGVNKYGFIDYAQVERMAVENGVDMIVAGASAYSRHIDWAKFKDIARKVNAYLLCDMAHYSGLIAARRYPSPLPYADVVTSTTHKTLRGPRGGMILWNNPNFTKRINSAIFPGTQGGPLMNIIAAKAQCFVEASEPAFGRYIDEVIDNARTMAKVFMKAGYNVITGGTDSHVFLLDLSDKKISGREAADRLEENGITVNKNGVPNDPRNFIETSGIRIGTAAETTKNRSNYWFENLAEMMIEILEK